MIKLKKILYGLFQVIPKLANPRPYDVFLTDPKFIKNTVNKNIVPVVNKPVPLPVAIGILGVGSLILGIRFLHARRKKK